MLNAETITELKKFYEEIEYNEDKKIPDNEQQMYLDISTVFSIIPKTEKTKRIFNSVFKGNGVDCSHLNYKKSQSVCVSLDYLTTILTILQTVEDENDTVKLIIENDKPIIFEVKQFKIVLAPKLSSVD